MSKRTRISRRQWFGHLGQAAATGALAPVVLLGQSRDERGVLVGEPTAERVAGQVFHDGGNVVDAIVAGALAAAVAAPHQTGIGGYGGSAVLAVNGGTRIVALDFNSAAPAAMRADTFRPTPDRPLPTKAQDVGWLAAGVPGILAGLQLAIDRFGTRSLDELVQPAIQVARDGYAWPAGAAAVVAGDPQLQNDPGSRKLYCPDGVPLKAGATFRNPEVAELLTTLARRNSVESFYRGDIAQRIAEAFEKNGGLVTSADMAEYQARVVEPLIWRWNDAISVFTAPLTAGGLTALQALRCLQAARWHEMPAGLPRTQFRIEALRLAWRDRLTLLGDPAVESVPVDKLLSDEYARASVERIATAVQAGQRLSYVVRAARHTGTIHLSAADRDGNLAALTLTHGNAFGARVTVEGLGLTLGHGMSRFDPTPGHPNSPGPRKRPLHNMTPTIVTRAGRALLAVGGRGGRKIPNALFELLTQFVLQQKSLADSMAAPRMHTEGGAKIELEKQWPAEDAAPLRRFGYDVRSGGSATLSATMRDGPAISKSMR